MTLLVIISVERGRNSISSSMYYNLFQKTLFCCLINGISKNWLFYLILIPQYYLNEGV